MITNVNQKTTHEKDLLDYLETDQYVADLQESITEYVKLGVIRRKHWRFLFDGDAKKVISDLNPEYKNAGFPIGILWDTHKEIADIFTYEIEPEIAGKMVTDLTKDWFKDLFLEAIAKNQKRIIDGHITIRDVYQNNVFIDEAPKDVADQAESALRRKLVQFSMHGQVNL